MQKIPKKLYLTNQVKEIERIVIDEQGVDGIELMRSAGKAVFSLIQQHYAGSDLVVLCGSGNNAGDGYVIAKLALESAITVRVIVLADPGNLRGDAMIAYQDFIESGGLIEYWNKQSLFSNDIVVDALLGTGVNRQVLGEYKEVIDGVNQTSCPVISVDIPSGLNADTGCVMGVAIKADHTMTFVGLKQGLFTGDAAEYCGDISYASLDIANDVFQSVNHSASLISAPHFKKRNRCAHKGSNGHVLVVGGEVGYAGAITLAAQASLRIGAGLVSVATRQQHCSFINMNRPEIMSHAVEELNELLPLLDKASVIVIGPGLGQSSWANELFNAVIQSTKPLIVDADALNLLAKNQHYNDNWVLTPHPGEAARLLNCSIADIASDRFAAISKLQSIYGGIVLLKGAGTLLYNGSEISISQTGNPGMASGGMGDLLSGMIAGLVAQKRSLSDAAEAAVYLHGKAADLSAQQEGEIGMIASDLLPYIRNLVNQ